MNVPEIIGRYEIIEELGRGAMGSVFKARDPAVGRIVALKTIHTTALEGAQSEEYRARFHREARASGVLAHPGIVPVFDVGEHHGAPFLVMEFVDGRTLADAAKKGERFSLDRVCEIGQQIAEALGYAHRQGVIHRDIKPANILMTSRAVYGSERPRITDFGIAKLVASEITTTGQLLGTPSFMPPEQFTGAPVDGRADLFSLGVILYSLATAEQPFPGETMTAVSYKVVHTDPVPPAKLNPAVSARLEAVILKCLAKNPAERYQTGEEIAQDLASIRNSATASTMQPFATPAAHNESDATLGPATIATLRPPAQTRKPETAVPAAVSPKPPIKPAKPAQFETIFAVILLSVAGLAAAAALSWYFYQHARSLAYKAPVPAAQPAPAPPPAASVPQPLASEPAPADSQPTPAEPEQPASSPEASKPVPAPEIAARPAVSKPAPVKLPAAKTAPVPPAPAPANPVVAKSSSIPPPVATTPAPHPPAAVFDPRKLDPNTSAKLKIDMSRFPIGVPYTVEMNGKVYLRGITGENVDLDNLFVPPGVQEFRITMRSGGQQKVSNVVSDEFKAKKRKTLRIELRGQATPSAASSEPLSGGAQIFLSLK